MKTFRLLVIMFLVMAGAFFLTSQRQAFAQSAKSDLELYYVEDESVKVVHTLEYTGGIFPGGSPLSTSWHELHPWYSRQLQVTSWYDNGDGIFSPSDIIDITPIVPPGPIEWYHVDKIRWTLYLQKDRPTQSIYKYIDYIGHDADILQHPLTSDWHEVWPTYCTSYRFNSWIDSTDKWHVTYFHIPPEGSCTLAVDRPPGQTKQLKWVQGKL